MSEIRESIDSVLPLKIIDDNGNVVETTICDSISGGAREFQGMPRELTLMRFKGGKVQRARYVHAKMVMLDGM